MIYAKTTTGELLTELEIKTFLTDLVNVGVKFDGTKDDKMKVAQMSRAGRTGPMVRKTRFEIYERAVENKVTNAEIARETAK